jgi:Flp pilus assembly protein TadG
MLARHSFVKDSRGNVAMLFAVTAVIAIGAVGGAVDYGRWLNAREQTQNAIDAALLGAGRVLQTSGSNEAAALQAAQQYFEQMKSLAPSRDTISFAVVDSGTAVQATGTAFISTPFLNLLGISELPLTVGGKVLLPGGANAVMSVEVSMMLDVTGSMSGQKIEDLKLAAKDLIDVIIWEDQSKFTSKVALVPFSEAVNVGPMAAQAATNASVVPTLARNAGQKVGFRLAADCVSERTGGEAFTDAAPIGLDKVGGVYTHDGRCSPPNRIVPLSNDKATLKSVIDNFEATGSTAGHLGTAWAWYTLSPNWGNVFGPRSRPAAYGAPKLTKIAILMTDGEYNTEYDRGISTWLTWGSSPNGTSTEQARQLCAHMKAAGITVYTVGFDLGGNQRAIDTLRTCATSSEHFYNATTGDELRLSFRDIALKISTLRLAE